MTFEDLAFAYELLSETRESMLDCEKPECEDCRADRLVVAALEYYIMANAGTP